MSGPTGRERSAEDRSFAFALLVVFLVASDALLLAGVRRPFHDTAWELLAWRMWVSDLLHAGDWPFWFPYARYGFALTPLQFAPGPWSPVGIALGAIVRADVMTLVVENVCWQALGLVGAYLFARRHVSESLSRAAVAVAYVGSGVMSEIAGGGSIGGSMLASVMLAPWLLVGVHEAVRAESLRDRCRAIGGLALAGGMLVLNGYPGLSLTTPVLLLPYALTLALASRRVRQLTVSAVVAGALIAGMLLPFLVDTLRYPIFGPGFRDPIDPGTGALSSASFFGLWLVDPSYLADADVPLSPLYMGLIPALLLSLTLPQHMSRALSRVPLLRPGLLALAGTLAVLAALAPRASSDRLYFLPLCAALFAATAVPSQFRRWDSSDVALFLTTLVALTAATQNPLSDLLRRHVPPFTLVRWNHFFAWLPSLMLPALAWRTGEQALALIAEGPGTLRFRARGLPRTAWNVGLLLAAVAALAVAYRTFVRGTIVSFSPGSIGTVDLVWWATIAALWGAAAIAYRLTNASGRLLWAWMIGGACIGLGVALIAGHSSTITRLQYSYTHVPCGGVFLLDLIQWGIVLAALFYLAIRVFRAQMPPRARTRALLRAVVALTVLDLSLAGVRYLKSADHVIDAIGSQAPLVYERDTAYSFSGAQRNDLPGDASSAQRMRQLIIKRPSLAPIPYVQPVVAQFDRMIGEPTAFRHVTYFPPEWRVEENGRDVTVGADTFRRLSQNVSSGPQPGADNGCPTGSTSSAPTAAVTRWLSSVMRLSVHTECERLLVLMDSWAPGWNVSIDGMPAHTLRVDGAVRGVFVPAGEHTVDWRFRPEHFDALLSAAAVSLLTSVAMLAVPSLVKREQRIAA